MSLNNIKILSVCTSDSFGGAARAAYRIHQSIKYLNADSRLFVQKKESQDPEVIPIASFIPQNGLLRAFDLVRHKCSNKINKFRWSRYPNRDNVLLSNLRGVNLHGALQKIDYDVLHLHWINGPFIPIDKLPKDRPIVWTLHDSWPFCGVCHYFLDCTKYQTSCGQCPFLHSSDEKDLSYHIWRKKLSIYKDLDLHIVTPSRWLGDCAKKSSLLGRFPITVIPNSLDTDVFRPLEDGDICSQWSELHEITKNKKVVLYGAVGATTDKIKGYDKLLAALKNIEQNGKADNIHLVVFGASSSELKMDLNIPIHFVGYVQSTEALVSLYNLADVMVVPSLTENLSCAIMESLSCQTPVAAFNIGGNGDMIEHQRSGYLARERDPEDLAKGIVWCLDNNEGNRLGIAGREHVTELFAPEVVGRQYLNLYSSVYEDALTKRVR